MGDEPMWAATNTTAAPLTIADLRAAMNQMVKQDEQRWKERCEAATRVGIWLDTLPWHARRHVFVQTLTQSIVDGAVFHPNHVADAESEVQRICALSPEESDADSAALVQAFWGPQEPANPSANPSGQEP